MTKYRYVGNHPRNFEVGKTSTMYGRGEFLKLSDDDVKNNQDAIDEGLLVEVSKTKGDK